MTKNPKDPMHQRVILGTNAGAQQQSNARAKPRRLWLCGATGEFREVSPDDPSLRRNGVQKNDATKRT